MNIITAEDHALMVETIAAILCLPTEAITSDMEFDFALGHMDEGNACTLWMPGYQRSAPSISSGPSYNTTAPGLTATGKPYRIACGAGIALRSKGEAFPDEWRADTDDLVTGMGAGEW